MKTIIDPIDIVITIVISITTIISTTTITLVVAISFITIMMILRIVKNDDYDHGRSIFCSPSWTINRWGVLPFVGHHTDHPARWGLLIGFLRVVALRLDPERNWRTSSPAAEISDFMKEDGVSQPQKWGYVILKSPFMKNKTKKDTANHNNIQHMKMVCGSLAANPMPSHQRTMSPSQQKMIRPGHWKLQSTTMDIFHGS